MITFNDHLENWRNHGGFSLEQWKEVEIGWRDGVATKNETNTYFHNEI